MGTTIVEKAARILHLEDNPNDAEIVRMVLQDEGLACSIHRVGSRHEFEQALEGQEWDVVISDFALPGYDGMKALALARERLPGVPFILFSGTIGEETAVQSLKNGASDYILKQRPARLAAALRQALKEKEERQRRQQMEAELLKAEERKKELEAQFLRMQRMESIGTLVGGIAHDLNNALVPVFMGIGLLRSEKVSPEAQQVLATMESSARRGAEMLKHVLAFARGAEGKKAVVQVEMLLREMGKIVTEIFPKSIEGRIKVPSGLWTVSGHATQLHQVLMNLCINARDAMPEGGQLTMTAENVMYEKELPEHPDAAPGPHVVIKVTDTGTGMPPEVLQKIFQPFFTTKELGRGTGLGLSTSLNIVKNHGGFITVQSRVGEGTTFLVHLPAVTTAPLAQLEQKLARLPTGNGELILVVDDEPAICELTKATLENYGYRVLAASSGPEAVAMFAERRPEIQLVITDTSMPYMDGRATSLALRRIDPKIKIIAASGDAERRRAEEDTTLRINVNAFIPKPYTMERLLVVVHQVLTGKPVE